LKRGWASEQRGDERRDDGSSAFDAGCWHADEPVGAPSQLAAIRPGPD
jgi:hypothetical protein